MISLVFCISSPESNRSDTTASAPIARAFFSSRDIASARDSAASLVSAETSPPTNIWQPATNCPTTLRERTVMPQTVPMVWEISCPAISRVVTTGIFAAPAIAPPRGYLNAVTLAEDAPAALHHLAVLAHSPASAPWPPSEPSPPSDGWEPASNGWEQQAGSEKNRLACPHAASIIRWKSLQPRMVPSAPQVGGAASWGSHTSAETWHTARSRKATVEPG